MMHKIGNVFSWVLVIVVVVGLAWSIVGVSSVIVDMFLVMKDSAK